MKSILNVKNKTIKKSVQKRSWFFQLQFFIKNFDIKHVLWVIVKFALLIDSNSNNNLIKSINIKYFL